MEQSQAFYDLILILGVATIAAVIAALLRQPVVVAFIGVGIVVGPAGLGVVTGESEFVEVFGQVGIALLLFVVGAAT